MLAASALATPVPWYFYAAFLVFVLAMLAIDLAVFSRGAETPSMKRSGGFLAIWVGLAIGFGATVYFWQGAAKAIEFISGYLVEYSLSVDNLFVFVLIFTYFSVPLEYQHRVLFYGILGAIVFRGIFIALGVGLVTRFEWILYFFGILLVITAIRVARGVTEVSPDKNPIVRRFKKHFPVTADFHGNKMFIREAGKRLATPLFIVLLVVETTDIVFAVDSIPAIFGLTRDPFIILTSNVFAVLGLRALYFVLAGALHRLHLLKYGLAVILAFVGLKMLLTSVVHIKGWISLAVIVSVLAITALASLLHSVEKEQPASTGSHE